MDSNPISPSLALLLVPLLCGACPSGPASESESGDTEATGPAPTVTDTEPTPTADADGTADDGSGTGPAPDPIAGECPLGERVGNFDVILEPAYSAINGEVREALVRATIDSIPAEEGECWLLRRENPFCDPPCSGAEVCNADAACVPYPARISVGTVTITGLEVPVTIEPAADDRYFLTDLPHPAVAPGATVELTADGIALDGRGFPMLSLTSPDLFISEGMPLEVSWEAGDGEAVVRAEINIDQHGVSPATLMCDMPDTGSYSIPASIIDALIVSGTSGFPSAHFYRQTIDSTQAPPGCVELRIRAHAEATVEVEGHIACNGPADCPPGMVCNLPIQTCE